MDSENRPNAIVVHLKDGVPQYLWDQVIKGKGFRCRGCGVVIKATGGIKDQKFKIVSEVVIGTDRLFLHILCESCASKIAHAVNSLMSYGKKAEGTDAA